MKHELLIAGIGNIFQGDDAFGVGVVQRLAHLHLPECVRLMDVGIRSIDLAFALLDEPGLTILVDAASRGGLPGTVYTIEIRPGDIPDDAEDNTIVNSHSLDAVRVLSMARTMGASFNRILLVACEPLTVDQDESGYIGLSAPVSAAVDLAVQNVLQLIGEHLGLHDTEDFTTTEEVLFHECT